jgi:hypothetical protein
MKGRGMCVSLCQREINSSLSLSKSLSLYFLKKAVSRIVNVQGTFRGQNEKRMRCNSNQDYIGVSLSQTDISTNIKTCFIQMSFHRFSS